VYESMRELARREPTFALHVHVGVEDPEDALRLYNSLRAHAPLLLALSSNSPFWQGRDAGLASTWTPIFQMFPRVGIPRAFRSYADYVEAIDMMLRSDAFPEPTFLRWDVRLQPRFGTVELRTMDARGGGLPPTDGRRPVGPGRRLAGVVKRPRAAAHSSRGRTLG
jgi:glutamate---cysteine ligase / carboxylate-amine ligase